MNDDVVCDVPLKTLEAPELTRPYSSTIGEEYTYSIVPFDMNWVWEQYDSQVMGNTIRGPGQTPAIVRIPNSKKAIAMMTYSNAQYCNVDPKKGAESLVYYCYNDMLRVGAKPLGITNCLNFGNPENENVMYEFVQTIDGLKDACKQLRFPVVSGNVSFYNETSGKGIMPTPVVGAVGLIEDYEDW
jgi:phosphoribosylformylglycinamidine synthase